jgi:hypothetical protein
VIACLGLLACEPADPQLDISMTISPVIAMGAVRAIVVLFPAEPPTSCEVLRLSEKSSDASQIGTYRSTVQLQGSQRSTELFDLVPGDYQVAVFVYDGESDLVGFGCQMNPVQIELGKRTETPTIEVRALPGG